VPPNTRWCDEFTTREGVAFVIGSSESQGIRISRLQIEILQEFEEASRLGRLGRRLCDHENYDLAGLSVRLYFSGCGPSAVLARLSEEDQKESCRQRQLNNNVGAFPSRTVELARVSGVSYFDLKRRGTLRYKTTKVVGICTQCERSPPETGKTKCEPCLRRQVAASLGYQRRKRDNALCLQCGMPTDGRFRCTLCQSKANQTAAKWRQAKKVKGICPLCTQPAAEGHSYCANHLAKEKARHQRRRGAQ
jgi:hypothetical protein